MGENFDGTPNFGTAAGGTGKLATRPKYFVPVLVPLLDETTTRAQQNQLAQARREGVANLPDAVAPTYYWVYRPEMQFSVFDWQVNEILRTDMDSANIQNIINLDEPMIRETDLVDVLFTLMSPTNAELESMGTPRQLTLSIGGEEIQLTTTDTQITFFDLTHLSQLGSEDYLTIRLYQNNDSFNVLYQFEFKLERMMLADFNRDGKITFDSLLRDETGARTDVTLESRPFVFWVNDDDDDDDSEVKGNDIDGWNGNIFDPYFADANNPIIDGSRDLIDFVAVGVKLHTFLKNNPESVNYTFTFKQADSAVNIVYTDMDLDHTNNYQKNLNVDDVKPVFGSWQNATVLTDVPVHKVTGTGINLPTEFIQAIKNSERKGVFLVEFNKATTEPLELVVTDTEDKEVFNAKLYVRVVLVEELFLQASLRVVESDQGWGWNGATANVSGLVSQWHNDRELLLSKVSDGVDPGKNIVFVHGFHNDVNAARAFQRETYKRLYHSGSNAVLTGIHWNGNEGLFDGGVNYWANVENAFNSADELTALVNELGGNTVMIGHSLGNVLIGSAVTDFDLHFSRYFMLNPAVAIEAYDPGQLNVSRMHHDAWDQYYFAADDTRCTNAPATNGVVTDDSFSSADGRRLWSSEWHSLFAADDARSKLTWRNRFAAVVSRAGVTQYYSTGEEVLRQAECGVPSSLGPARNGGSNAWNVQEKAKGTDMLAAVAAGQSAAGWGFGETCITADNCSGNNLLSKNTAQRDFYDKPNAELAATPFFKPFNNSALHNAQSGSEAARQTHPHVLAYEIPSLSFAAGGTELVNLPPTRIGKTDMNNYFRLNNTGWPQERRVRDWLHSDFKDVAYRYTYPVFDEMVTAGQLK